MRAVEQAAQQTLLNRENKVVKKRQKLQKLVWFDALAQEREPFKKKTMLIKRLTVFNCENRTQQ